MDKKIKDSNNRILKLSVINGFVFVTLILLAVFFVQLGNTYELQAVYATTENTTETTPEASEAETDAPEKTGQPVETETSTTENTPAPETTSPPATTEITDETETPDDEKTAEPTGTSAPEDTSGSEIDSPDETAIPEESAVLEPSYTASALPETPVKTAKPTPSPTLADIEEPYVSGGVVIDVEDEKYTPMVSPISSAVADSDSGKNKDTTSGSDAAVAEKGSLSKFFDVMVYIFIGCAVVTAGYGVFLAVKLISAKRKMQKNDEKNTEKEHP